MLEIRTFGVLNFRDPVAGADLDGLLSRPKRAALLAYLATARPHGCRRRDELFRIFWPDSSQKRARRALNQSIYVLRGIIGRDAIIGARSEDVGLDPAWIRADAAAFEEALDRGDRLAALDLYRGEFLAAFHLSGSRDFERWLDAEREHYRQRATEAAAREAAVEEDRGNLADAIRWARTTLELNPYDESRCHHLVRLLLARGDAYEASRELERFAARRRIELDLDISAETRALLDGCRPLHRAHPGAVGRTEVEQENSSDDPAAAPGVAVDSKPPAYRAHRYRFRVGRLAAAAILAIGAAWVLSSSVRPGVAAHEPPRVVVAPLENRTGHEALEPLGRIAADWVSRGLLRTGLVQVLPSPPGDDTASARGAADLLVSGSYHLEDRRLVIEARIVDLDRHRVVRALPPIFASPDAPLEGAVRLRQRTAGALATLVDPRFKDWADDASQPPDFAAYLEFVEGMKRVERGDYRGAIDRFMKAASRDSGFTAPKLWALEAYSLRWGTWDSLAVALEPKRDRLGPWERAMLDQQLAELHGDRWGAYEALETIVRLSPTPQWRVLAAEQANRVDRPHRALQLLAGIDPDRITGVEPMRYWITVDNALHELGRYEEELAVARRRDAGSPMSRRFGEFSALAGLGRGAEVQQWVERNTREWKWTPSRALFLDRVARELRAHGQLAPARAVLDRALDLYRTAPDSARRDDASLRDFADLLYVADRWKQVRTLVTGLIAEGRDPHVLRGTLGLATARLGDRVEAAADMRYYEEWGRAHPRGLSWATQWRARIAAALGDEDRAVRLLRLAHAQGWAYTVFDHANPEYERLRGYAPFQEMMSPADE